MAEECPRSTQIFRGVVEALELALALLLAATIILASGKLISLIYHDTALDSSVSKENVLEVLDLILLLVLAIDILRTLVTAVMRRRFPIRIVVEAAMLAILREIISVEIRHLDWLMLLSLAIVFLILAVTWIIIGVMERKGQIREAMGEI